MSVLGEARAAPSGSVVYCAILVWTAHRFSLAAVLDLNCAPISAGPGPALGFDLNNKVQNMSKTGNMFEIQLVGASCYITCPICDHASDFFSDPALCHYIFTDFYRLSELLCETMDVFVPLKEQWPASSFLLCSGMLQQDKHPC